MKELDIQTKTIKAVEAAGGAAVKLSNRFLIGVADLLIKLPEIPTMLMEVKLNLMPIQKETVNLDTTKLQQDFLRSFGKAGVDCGVISFLWKKDKGGNCINIWGNICDESCKTLSVTAHTELGISKDFNRNVVEMLMYYPRGY